MTTIIHILSDANYSGAPSHVLTLTKGLDSKAFRSYIVGPSGPIKNEFDRLGIDYYPITYGSKFSPLTMLKLRKIIRGIINKRSTDNVIIHCHGVRAGLFGRHAAKAFPYPVIYTEHSWTADYHLPNKLNEQVQIAMLHNFDRFTTKTIGVSQVVVDFLVDKKITTKDKIVLIYDGIDMPKNQIPISKNMALGSVGSLTWQKNYEALIELMPEIIKQVPETKLEIIGSGPKEEEVKKLIKNLKMEKNVEIIEPVSHERLLQYYARWGLYIQPSTNESFGLALAEAIAAGLPALGNDVGSIPEILGTKNGLFDLTDKEKTVEKIVDYLKNYEKRITLHEAEFAHVKQFTVEKMLSEHEKLYYELSQ